MTIDFITRAQAMREELIERRRDFHRHPELAFEEFRTAGIVAEELGKLGLEVQTGVGKTGVVGILEGDSGGPTVLVRADMDALPILEANTVDYASSDPGKMHACGHDGHTTIALGVAKLFAENRDKIRGRIKFVFQPAEEIGAGAKAMVADGVLSNDPLPDVTLGLHLWNTMPLGTLGVADGPVMAGASTLKIRILGTGGHAASPHQTHDPVVCAAQLVLALQTIISRNLDPLETAVLSITQVIAGTAFNVIPEVVELRGTIRTFKREVFDMVAERVHKVSHAIAESMGCQAEVEAKYELDAVVNNPEVGRRVRNVFSKLVGEDKFYYERTMGSEDVGLFMNDIPGMFFFLGSADESRGLNYPHHHPRFDFDEEVLPLGVALLSAAVADYVLTGE